MTTPARTVRRPALARTAALAAWALAAVQTLAGTSLDDRIDTLVTRAQLGSTVVGIAAIDVRTGELLAEYHPDRAMIPASNMKLLTSGAALRTLGPEFAFRTRLLLDTSDGTSRLILEGDGDPSLGDPEILAASEPAMGPADLLERMAQAAVTRGLQSLGEVIVDDRVFDRTFVHASWPTDQLNRWYCAEVGGVNFHTNVLTLFPRPTSKDSQPSVEVEPPARWVEITNRARTVSEGRNTAWVARPRPANEFTLYGDVRTRTQIDVSIHNPPAFTGSLLAAAAARLGVRTPDAPPPQIVRLAESGERFDRATPVAVVTTPIADVLRRCNADSQNLYAECLLKRTGRHVTGEPGSWENGSAVLRMMIGELVGTDAATTTVIADGSGMSRDNRVSPETLATWLRELYRDDRLRDTFLASMPTTGEGTLSNRFREVRLGHEVRAKSGYLSGVYSLSGYVIDPAADRAVAFSVLLNEVPPGQAARNAKPFHERVVAAIDQWLAEQAEPAASLGG
jgi:D-alanyl-D-alanine carboxypeptidase/D-alanyl-D-alanine-endopeptidase (penicillin-binding protein 4)